MHEETKRNILTLLCKNITVVNKHVNAVNEVLKGVQEEICPSLRMLQEQVHYWFVKRLVSI